MMVELLGALTWAPGFKGVLTVAVAVAILCGSVALILGTNSGARLGFLIALTGLMGWFFVMGVIWTMYGIGYVGDAPSWKLVDTVSGPPAASRIPVARDLPLPSDLDDPVAIRDASEELLAEFPPTAKDPILPDLVTVQPDLRERIEEQSGDWRVLETSNRYTGETQAVVGEALGPDGEGIFAAPADYIVVNSFVTGGKSGRTDDSIVGRVIYKFTSTFEFGNENLYAAVQLQPVIPQEAGPGEAPPLPVANPEAPVYTVILERDRGDKRLPAFVFTVASGLIFGVTASMLHRRDKLVAVQRAAVAGAGAA